MSSLRRGRWPPPTRKRPPESPGKVDEAAARPQPARRARRTADPSPRQPRRRGIGGGSTRSKRGAQTSAPSLQRRPARTVRQHPWTDARSRAELAPRGAHALSEGRRVTDADLAFDAAPPTGGSAWCCRTRRHRPCCRTWWPGCAGVSVPAGRVSATQHAPTACLEATRSCVWSKGRPCLAAESLSLEEPRRRSWVLVRPGGLEQPVGPPRLLALGVVSNGSALARPLLERPVRTDGDRRGDGGARAPGRRTPGIRGTARIPMSMADAAVPVGAALAPQPPGTRPSGDFSGVIDITHGR